MLKKMLGITASLMLAFCANLAFAEEDKTLPVPGDHYPIEILFAPSGGIKDKLASLVQNAQSSICIAAYNLFLPDISLSLLGAKSRGVKIRIIADPYGTTEGKSDIPLFKNNQIPVQLRGGASDAGAMEHSFAIFDGSLLAMGSYQWTQTGEQDNLGSMIFTRDKDTLNTVINKFEELWAD